MHQKPVSGDGGVRDWQEQVAAGQVVSAATGHQSSIFGKKNQAKPAAQERSFDGGDTVLEEDEFIRQIHLTGQQMAERFQSGVDFLIFLQIGRAHV